MHGPLDVDPVRPTALRTRRLRAAPPTVTAAVALAACATTWIAPASAAADDPPKRAAPDYDGRPEPPPTAAEVMLWVPRVALYPIYLLSEYAVRRPWGAALRGIEDMSAETRDTDTFGVVPTLELETERRPVVGAMAIWRELGSRDHDLRVHAAFGGTDWLRGIASSRVALGPESSLELRLEASRRPDGLYFGIGPETLPSAASRFATDTLEAAFVARLPAWQHVHLQADGGLRRTRFDELPCCEEPSVATRVFRGDMAAPPGLEGATRWRQGLGVAVESRSRRGVRETGASASADAAHAMDVDSLDLPRWIQWGGALEGEVDVTGTQRMLGLELLVRFADPLGSSEVPFSELVALGGDGPMRGFVGGRLLGRSATVATLGWRYPLWPLMETGVHVACGNVWGEHLEGWAAEDLRLSFGISIRSDDPAPKDWLMEILLAAGTETFEQGTAPEALRVVLALTPRF